MSLPARRLLGPCVAVTVPPLWLRLPAVACRFRACALTTPLSTRLLAAVAPSVPVAATLPSVRSFTSLINTLRPPSTVTGPTKSLAWPSCTSPVPACKLVLPDTVMAPDCVMLPLPELIDRLPGRFIASRLTAPLACRFRLPVRSTVPSASALASRRLALAPVRFTRDAKSFRALSRTMSRRWGTPLTVWLAEKLA